MSRRAYGGDAASMVVTVGAASGALTASRNATVTMWNAPTAGSQLTDLLAADGVTPITAVTALADGSLPQFFGPDGVAQLWASAPGAAERMLILPTDDRATYAPRAGGTTALAAAAPALNVKDFGATGDSVTDDTAAVQAAITAAGGRVPVWFPSGGYKLTTSALSLPTGTRLVGPGAHRSSTTARATIFQTTAGVHTIVNADQVNGNTDIILYGLEIQHTAVTGTADCVNFAATGGNTCQGIRILQCWVVGATRDAISWTNVKESEILSCEPTQVGRHGIFFSASSDNTVAANACWTNNSAANAAGIALTNSSGNNIIRGNLCYLSNYGIYVGGGKGNIITGNRCNTNVTNGIVLQDSTGADNGNVQHNIVANNYCYDNASSLAGSRAGILVDNADWNLIIGNDSRNDLTTNQTNGIRLSSAAANNLVTANIVTGNGSAGINNTSTATNNILRGNSGFNPVGHAVAQPAVPATTVAATNTTGVDCTVHVAGGTVTAIAVGGSATGLTSGTFRVLAGQTITLTYTVAPTWQWFGD